MRYLWLVVAVFICGQAAGAEFKRLPPIEAGGLPVAFIELKGPIQAGDVERLQKLIRPEDADILLSLDSGGGDFQAGIALAKYLNEKPIATTVTGNNRCISACAIAFLGGTAWGEETSEWPARSLDQFAKLGFHAPYLELSEGQYDSEGVSRAYDRAVRTIVQTIRTAPYLQVAAEDVAALMVPQREELFLINTVESLGRYAVAASGLEMPRRLTRSMAVSLCVNGWMLSDPGFLGVAMDDANRFDLALETIEGADWDAAKASFRSTTPFGEDARSIVIPIGPGNEGTLTFCIVDQVKVEGSADRIECRGFVRYEQISEAVEVAREWSEVEVPCNLPTIVDPRRGAFDLDNIAWAMAPPRTALSDIGSKLAELASAEKALPAP